MRGEQERAAEALDLKPAGRLRVKAVPETARRDRGEGRDDEQRDTGQHGDRLERAAPSRSGPHVDERRRHDHDRVELRAHGQPQEPERQQVPPAQQRSESSRGQRRRPEVVGVQGDRPDHERREREQGGRSVEPASSHAQAQQRQRDGKERAQPAERHQALEGEVVVPGRKHRGRQEDGERSGRILDEEVAVGQLAPEELVCVDAVEMDVAVPLAPEEASVGNRAGRQKERRSKRGRPAPPASSRPLRRRWRRWGWWADRRRRRRGRLRRWRRGQRLWRRRRRRRFGWRRWRWGRLSRCFLVVVDSVGAMYVGGS